MEQKEIRLNAGKRKSLTNDYRRHCESLSTDLKDKYNQARNTPCRIHLLKTLLGIIADFFQQTSFRWDLYCFLIYATIRSRITHRARISHTNRPEIRSHNNIESYIPTGWNKMGEHTLTGIRGIHFGCMKTEADDNLLPQVETSSYSIPDMSGLSPDR